jgi:hypothetical protein
MWWHPDLNIRTPKHLYVKERLDREERDATMLLRRLGYTIMTREEWDDFRTNRDRKTEPKRGLSWCPRCDRDLIGEGERCSCGFKDTVTKHRKPQRS